MRSYWLFSHKSLHTSTGDIDPDYEHIDQAWEIIRYSNQRTHKLTRPSEFQSRSFPQKKYDDCVKLAVGDIVKFGRVRFRVKALVVNDHSDV